MDISDRLKMFIDQTGLTYSQFADRTGIPRPTLSQILNKRNKTINDVLLRKLNDRFPELDITWLLFGKGSMKNDSDFKTSEAEKTVYNDDSDPYIPYNKDIIDNDDDSFPNLFSDSEKKSGDKEGLMTENEPKEDLFFEEKYKNDVRESVSEEKARTIRKSIKYIITFYDDDTFETFYPEKDN